MENSPHEHGTQAEMPVPPEHNGAMDERWILGGHSGRESCGSSSPARERPRHWMGFVVQ